MKKISSIHGSMFKAIRLIYFLLLLAITSMTYSDASIIFKRAKCLDENNKNNSHNEMTKS